jgi:transcription initiation factor TFIIB
MEEIHNIEDTEKSESIPDQLDSLSDDNLWNILDSLSDNKESKPIINNLNKVCVGCNSQNLIYTSGRGSFVCGECGIESQEILDESPEWNNYEDGKCESSRCGAPINAFFPKSSLGTTINAPGYSKVKMLRNWGHIPYRERSLAEVLNEMDHKCKKYKITKAVIDNAKILYKNIRDTKHISGKNSGKNVIIRGINRKQIIAACFYFGAILQHSPRSTKEVADIFELELKQLTKGCRRFLEIMKDNFIVFDIIPSHGSDFIERYGTKLKLSKETIQLAKTISINSTKLDIVSDHQATSIAATSILLAANILNQELNKKLISEIFLISDVTITKTYKKIFPYQKIVTNDDISNIIYNKMNIKFMSDILNNDISDIDTETETETEIESETEQLITKLNIQNESNSPIQLENEILLDEFGELDESDVIKKENTQSKYNKFIQLQHDREKRKEDKKKLKEEKHLQIQKDKELAKIIKQQKKLDILSLTINNNSNTNNQLIKRGRGRPKLNKSQILNV